MKIIHQNGYTVDELAMYRLTIYKNLVDCAKLLVGAMRQFDIDPESSANRVSVNIFRAHVSAANSYPRTMPNTSWISKWTLIQRLHLILDYHKQ
jgi:hypothetical protein